MNHGHITASSIRVSEDEGRIVLLIDSDDEDTLTVNIHSIALDFYQEVQRELRPWFLEAEHARQAVAAGVTLKQYVGPAEDGDDGYDPSDPKSSGWLDRMAG